jgi:branched-chain amino acid transport system ATP-binding protein
VITKNKGRIKELEKIIEGVKITKHFGGLAAVKDVDFYIGKGEIVALIGPNGAGKTTLFNCVSGYYRPERGTIYFNGKNIAGMKPYEVCRLGIGRTFQIPRPFLNITVLKNVLVGAVFGDGKHGHSREVESEALRCLEFVGLLEKKDVLVRNLNLNDRKILEVARALSTNPRVLLLDEVIAGLNPIETQRAMELINRIRDELGITVFWIEHVMRAVMSLADRIIVLHHGEKIAEGAPHEVANDDRVVSAYLGEKYIF